MVAAHGGEQRQARQSKGHGARMTRNSALRTLATLISLSFISISLIMAADLDHDWKLIAFGLSVVICLVVAILLSRIFLAIWGTKLPRPLGRRYPSGGEL
jgi:hypothetical protein